MNSTSLYRANSQGYTWVIHGNSIISSWATHVRSATVHVLRGMRESQSCASLPSRQVRTHTRSRASVALIKGVLAVHILLRSSFGKQEGPPIMEVDRKKQYKQSRARSGRSSERRMKISRFNLDNYKRCGTYEVPHTKEINTHKEITICNYYQYKEFSWAWEWLCS